MALRDHPEIEPHGKDALRAVSTPDHVATDISPSHSQAKRAAESNGARLALPGCSA